MKYLRLFKNQSEYQAYIDGDDIWLPRVSLIYNKGDAHTSDDPYDDNGPSRYDFSWIGTEFIQVANDGVMYFTNKVYNNVEYSAEISGDALVIKTIDLSTGLPTNDAYIDDDSNSIVVNYPNGDVHLFAMTN